MYYYFLLLGLGSQWEYRCSSLPLGLGKFIMPYKKEDVAISFLYFGLKVTPASGKKGNQEDGSFSCIHWTVHSLVRFLLMVLYVVFLRNE